MIKIAILTTGDLEDMKGVMNYVNEKNYQFIINNDGSYSTTCFFLQFGYSRFLRFIFKLLGKRVTKQKLTSTTIHKGIITYQIANINLGMFALLAGLITKRYYSNSVIKQLVRQYPEIIKYDLISSHQLPAHYFAMQIKRFYGVPYFTTWHGSDINVSPYNSNRIFATTKKVIENANINYFVSKRLLQESEKITTEANKDYIYTGPSHLFRIPTIFDRQQTKEKNHLNNCIVVTFLGNIIPIKNVLSLPNIFKKVSDKINGQSVKFWIIGNGVQENDLCLKLEETEVDYTMFGKVAPEQIPEYLKATDILVLPSLNEGLPLSVLEAIMSGCHVVAAKVGGVPECVIPQNCIEHGAEFEENFSSRIAEIINKRELPVNLPQEFSWEEAVKKELHQCKLMLNLI